MQAPENGLAIDMAEPELILALNNEGMEIVNAEKIVERAAAIKSEDELRCITTSVSIAQAVLAWLMLVNSSLHLIYGIYYA